MVLALPCENVSSGISGQQRPRSACACAQSDQGLRCPLTESLDTTECFNEEQCPDETLCMRRINLNLCILRMLDGTFSLGAAEIMVISLFQ